MLILACHLHVLNASKLKLLSTSPRYAKLGAIKSIASKSFPGDSEKRNTLIVSCVTLGEDIPPRMSTHITSDRVKMILADSHCL